MRDRYFERLCSKYYKNVFRYILFCIKDEDAAADIVQETFVTVYKKLDEKHPNPGGFIFQTAKNIIKEYKRKLYKRIMYEISEDERYNIPDTANTIEKAIDGAINEYEYVTDILSQLSEEKYRLYKLYYIDRLPMDKIARDLGIEYTALRMRYVRLRKEIRSLVKKLAEEKF